MNSANNSHVFVGEPGQGYLIVGLTRLLIYRQYATRGYADAIKECVKWALKDCQQFNYSILIST